MTEKRERISAFLTNDMITNPSTTQTGGEETKNEDDGKDCRYQEPATFLRSVVIVNHGYVSNKVI